MRLFDLHCDTLYRAVTENKTLNEGEFHVSIQKGRALEHWIQCMAIWIPDDVSVDDSKKLFLKAHALLKEECKKHSIIFYQNKQDLRRASETNCPCFIFTVENGKILQGDLRTVSLLKDCGVKMLTLTWNGHNEIGGGSESSENSGITEFGKKVVTELEKSGIILDVSHAGEKLFYDVLERTKKPVVASHSNAKAQAFHTRNLTDDQFRCIVQRNGLVGLNFYGPFLNADNSRAGRFDLLRHAEHFLSLGGENTLAIGSDFDGCDLPRDIAGLESMEEIYEMFLRENYSEKLVKKLFFENAYKFCENFDNL